MERLKLNIQRFATSGTLTTPNNTDGTSFYFYWSRQSYSIADNKSTIYWQIGINAAYSYYSNGVKLGPTTVNGTVIHSGGTYSNISRGTHTMFEGTMDIPHNPDGTKSFSASLSGWTWGSTWTSADNSNNPFVLDTIPRYTTVSTWSVTSRTETSITLSWKTADTCSQIRYGTSTSSYTTANVNGNSGTVTISGLTAGQTYTLYFMPKRKDSSLWGDGSDGTWKNLTNQSTHPYPYAETMPAFTIGENPTIGIKNPLNRTFTITVYGADNSTIYTGSNKTGTSIKDILNETTAVNNLYQSLPTTKSGKYKVKIETTLPSSTTKDSGNNLYSVNENDCRPVFNDFTYADINATTLALTGNNQVVVQGYSNIQATISVANKAIATKGADMNTGHYDLIITGNNTQSANYSDNADVTITTNGANSGSIKVSAVDSRNVAKEVPKTANVISYTNIQRGNISVTRAGNVGEATTLAFEGTMWSGDFGAVTNTITSVQYRYKSTAAGSSWSAYTSLTPPTPSGNSYSFSGLIAGDEGNTGFSVDNSFNIEVVVSDRLSSITFTATLGTGIPHVAFGNNGLSIKQPYDTNDDSVLQVNGKTHIKNDLSVTGKITATGNVQANSFNNYILDLGTNNTADTWTPVMINNTLQHRVIPTIYNGNVPAIKMATIDYRISNANIAHTYENNKAHMQLLIASSSMTSNKPVADGFITHYSWDNNNKCSAQLYLPQGDQSTKQLQFRTENSGGTWTGWEDIYRAKTLYENSSGTTGTITLPETSANFKYIDIFYAELNRNERSFVRTYSPNGQDLQLTIITRGSTSSSDLRENTKTINFNGTSLTTKSNTGAVWFTTYAFYAVNEIRIMKVVGYR